MVLPFLCFSYFPSFGNGFTLLAITTHQLLSTLLPCIHPCTHTHTHTYMRRHMYLHACMHTYMPLILLMSLSIELTHLHRTTLEPNSWIADVDWVLAGTQIEANNRGTSNDYGAVNNNGSPTVACPDSAEVNCPKNVMDGHRDTVWHCASSPPCQLDFDLLISRIVTGIQLITFGERFTSGQLQYSTSASGPWTVSSSVDVAVPSPTEYTTVKIVPTIARYWRIANIHSSGTAWPAVVELQLRVVARPYLSPYLSTLLWTFPHLFSLFSFLPIYAFLSFFLPSFLPSLSNSLMSVMSLISLISFRPSILLSFQCRPFSSVVRFSLRSQVMLSHTL